MPILANLGGLATPTFMLKPPQEQLLEKVCIMQMFSSLNTLYFCFAVAHLTYVYFCIIINSMSN
jgi:hypothetical protein